MKTWSNKSLGVILGAVILLFTACAEGDEVFDQIVAAEQRGAIIRTLSVISNELPIGQSDSFFGVDLEVQDQQNGGLLGSVEVFLSFADNTVEPGGTDKSASEAMVATIPAADFTTGEFGLPRTSYSITLPEMLSSLGLAESDVDGGDVFSIRLELVLTDGRRFSNDDNSGTITGSYFSSPFLYSATVVCPPNPPTAGDWTVDMQDAFGDGWNGASLLFTIDGVETNVFLADGSAGMEAVSVPAGTAVISIVFVSGDWDGEITYTVTSASGNVVTEVTETYSTPDPGVELINYCVLNY